MGKEKKKRKADSNAYKVEDDDKDRLSMQVNRLNKIAFPALLILYFIVLLMWSWRKWPDILVDFGRELYIPWQISNGKVLYEDIANPYGPLSQYINASLFYLFGPSYTLIILMNMLVLTFILILIYLMIREACSELTAFMSCGSIISIFAFSQYVGIGNYNFVSPYSHEATHGTLLALIMIHQLWRFSEKNRKHNLILAGFTFGLIFLTKIEILFSALITAGFFFFLKWLICKNAKETIKKAGIFFASSIIPVFLFGAYFACVMPFKNVLRAILGSVISLYGTTGIVTNKFFIDGMGLDYPVENFMKMVSYTIVVILAIAMVLFLCHLLKKYYKDRLLFFVGLCTALLAVIISFAFNINPYEIGRPLPLLSFAAFIFLFFLFIKALKEDQKKAYSYIPMLLWSVFSICMLWKMILLCRIIHYGFYLSLPAVVLLVSMLIWYVPEWFNARYSGGSVFRIVAVIIIVIFSFKFVQISNEFYKAKTFSVGFGGDRIVTYDPKYDERSILISQAVEWISANVNDKETIIVIPEGVVINYLTRRINPTPYIGFTVTEIMIYGEDTILDSFKINPPNYFTIVHRNSKEYGFEYFGQDLRYGQKIMNWINNFYHPVCLLGNEPLKQEKFGIKIMKRNK